MFKEIIRFFSSNIRERVSSPIIGAFILIWCTLNWRGLYILFRPLPTARETIIAFDAVSSEWTLVYAPVFLTIAYLLISPWSHWAYFRFQAKPRQERVIAELQLEKTLLKAKKDVTVVAYEIEDIKVDREHKLEVRKLEAMAEIEEEKLRSQQRVESSRLMDAENRSVRTYKLEMERDKKAEIKIEKPD